MNTSSGQSRELICLILYAIVFYIIVIRRSLHLSHDHYGTLYGLRPGWIWGRFNDVSDAQWKNFRGNLPILSVVFGIFTVLANMSRACYHLKAKGMSIVWLLISFAYLSYLHGACIIFVLSIAVANFLLVKISGKKKYFPFVLWGFNISILICNRVFEGYRFSAIGHHLAYLDNFCGTFRWHICFNFVTLRQISFGYDYHWAYCSPRLDQKKHIQSCPKCSSGQTCHLLLQERNLQNNNFSLAVYLCYLLYAPLYIAGPVLSFNVFASQLDTPQKGYSQREVAWYGLRWVFSLLLMELMTHFFYYNAFAISELWKQISPTDVFIIGYGASRESNCGLKLPVPEAIIKSISNDKVSGPKLHVAQVLLIWRYFRFWSLISGIEAPENMPKCINNCYNLDTFWKSWHASFNKWLVRFMYIPLGGSQRKLLNVWVIFTFVAIWHDLEWKLLSWAWLTCVFFVPEMIVKSAATSFQVRSAFGAFVFRELSALAGAITITCLMVANLVGYVIGPSGMNWLISRFLGKEGLPTLGGMFLTFYVGTKLMFHIRDAKQRKD